MKEKLTPTLKNHETVRAAFPAVETGRYLNVGTYGIMPEPALLAYLKLVEEYERFGLFSTEEVHQKAEKTRRAVAKLLGCEATQITLTGNATDGINLVLAGMTWQEGDEVIITDEEHEAVKHPSLYLLSERGIKVHRVEVSPYPDVMIQRCNKVASKRTRLVAFSHVTCESGTRLPAAEICAWAAERDIRSLVDGAQSLGVFDIKVDHLGCDFFTSNGHKWLSGPKGTGIFYASPEQLLALSPAHVGAGSLKHADVDTGEAKLWPTGRRFEYGTRATTLYAGLGYSLEWLGNLGWNNIERYIAQLSESLKAQVSECSHTHLLTPRPFKQSSGLTTFVTDEWDAGELSRELWENSRIRVRVIPRYNATRISTAHFNNEADIKALMTVLYAITGK